MIDICTHHPRFNMYYIKGLLAAAQLVRPEQRVFIFYIKLYLFLVSSASLREFSQGHL